MTKRDAQPPYATPRDLRELNNNLAWHLGAFARYMNQPLKRVHVFTWALANKLKENCPTIRLLAWCRNEECKAFRIELARTIKFFRKHRRDTWRTRIELPIFEESTGRYKHSNQ